MNATLQSTIGRRARAFVSPAAALCVVVLLLAGCGIPHDAAGTVERARNGSLRAGITENPPWTSLAGARPQGREVELIEEFARTLQADVVWVRDAEADLFEALRRGELDVVVGGLRDSSPWRHQVSLTRPYAETGGQRRVMAVRQGESRMLYELERFLPRPPARRP